MVEKLAIIGSSLIVTGMLATVPLGLWLTLSLVKAPPKQSEIASTTELPEEITEKFVPYYQRKPKVVWEGKEEGRKYLKRWRATSVRTTMVKLQYFNTTTPTPDTTTTTTWNFTTTADTIITWNSTTTTADKTTTWALTTPTADTTTADVTLTVDTTTTSKSTIPFITTTTLAAEHDNVTITGLENMSLSTPVTELTEQPVLVVPTATTSPTLKPIHVHKFPAKKNKSLVNKSIEDNPSFNTKNETENETIAITWSQQQTTNLTITSTSTDLSTATNETTTTTVDESTTSDMNNENQTESNLNETLYHMANNSSENVTTFNPEPMVVITTNASDVQNLQETTRSPELSTMMTSKPTQNDTDNDQSTSRLKPSTHNESYDTTTSPTFEEISSRQTWTIETTALNLNFPSTASFETQLTTKNLTLTSLDDEFRVDNLTYTGSTIISDQAVTQLSPTESTTQSNLDFPTMSPFETTIQTTTDWQNEHSLDKHMQNEKSANASISTGEMIIVETTTTRSTSTPATSTQPPTTQATSTQPQTTQPKSTQPPTTEPTSYLTKPTTTILMSSSYTTSTPEPAQITMATPEILTYQTTVSSLNLQMTQEIMATGTMASEINTTSIEPNVTLTVKEKNETTTTTPTLVPIQENLTVTDQQVTTINKQSFHTRRPNSELLMPPFFLPKDSKIRPALWSDDWEDRGHIH